MSPVFMTEKKGFIDPEKILDYIEIQSGWRVADLGCGNSGRFVFPLAARVGSSGVVYALDILKNAVNSIAAEAAQRGFQNIEAMWSNIEQYNGSNIENNELDIAFLVNNLFQSHNHSAILREAYRIIKPQGKLVVIDWVRRTTAFGPPIEQRIDKKEFLFLCEENKFQFTQEFEGGIYHFVFLLEKI